MKTTTTQASNSHIWTPSRGKMYSRTCEQRPRLVLTVTMLWANCSVIRLSSLTLTNPNQSCDVLLFVCSKMVEETNLSSKLPVIDRTREVWGRKLCWRCLSSGFPLCTFLLILFASYSQAPLLMRPRHFVQSCAICSHDSVGMLKSLRRLWGCPCIASSDHHGRVFQPVVLHRGFSLANVHQAFW